MIEFEGWYWPDGPIKSARKALKKIRRFEDGDNFDYYQKKVRDESLKYVKMRGIALDIGAHIGLWSKPLSREFHKVMAFEPYDKHRECFKENLNATNVELYNLALGDKDGIVKLKTPDYGTFSSYILPIDNPTDSKIIHVANMRMLDTILTETVGISYMKLDVEGYEEYVLWGGEKLILRNRPVIIIEQKSHAERYGLNKKGAAEYLESLGYECVFYHRHDFVFAPAEEL